MSEQDAPESIVLHGCGPAIPVACEDCGETFTVEVHQFPDLSVDVVLTSQAPDAEVLVRWDLDLDAAEQLAHQLLHHAAVARDFKAQVN